MSSKTISPLLNPSSISSICNSSCSRPDSLAGILPNDDKELDRLFVLITSSTSSDFKCNKLDIRVCLSSCKLLISSRNSLFFFSTSLMRSRNTRFCSCNLDSSISVRFDKTAFRYSFSFNSSSWSASTTAFSSSAVFWSKVKKMQISIIS